MEHYDLAKLEKNAIESAKKHKQTLSKSNNAKTIKLLPDYHNTAFETIDCLKCANCCKNYSPRFKGPDIKRISKYLKMKESDFTDRYLKIDTDGDFVLQEAPCPFLDSENYCNIYEVRPRDCHRYPYTDEDVLVKQPLLTLKNAQICPAVFSVLEMLHNKLL